MNQHFNDICTFRRENPIVERNPLKVTDPILTHVKKSLEEFRVFLEHNFRIYRGQHFKVKASHGAGNFPNILHIAILPPGQTVSNGIYVVICFDKQGRGALVGCAESVTNPRDLNTVKRKVKNVILNIDVDGSSSDTKYNNCFENPKEYYSGLKTDTDLLNHIQVSLDLALYHLSGKSSELSIENRVLADIDNPDFNPDDSADGREKIARQINLRRGQKKFRNALLKAYDRKCAITGCTVESVLEAAHILPYKGDQTNHVQNGLLLRSDIHVLFDLGLLTIQSESKILMLSSELSDSQYSNLVGKKIFIPIIPSDQPHKDALRSHNDTEFKK